MRVSGHHPTKKLSLAVLGLSVMFCPVSVDGQDPLRPPRIQLSLPSAPTVEQFSPSRSGPTDTMRYLLPGRTQAITVHYQVIDGLAIAEGDIVLGPAEQIRTAERQRAQCRGDICTARQPLMQRTGEGFLWPAGVIPYEIDSAFSSEMRDRIDEGIRWINRDTDLILVPRTNERDYVFIRSVVEGCYSSVGRQGGRQIIGLENTCGVGSVAHEFLHAAGMWHEQSRSDRDNFITILWDSIEPGKEHNFVGKADQGTDIGTYDYNSIMHYPRNAFGIIDPATQRHRTTIQVRTAGVSIGRRGGLSPSDIAGVNSIYRAEDCLSFSANGARVSLEQGTWKIVDTLAGWIYDFGIGNSGRDQANRALQIIRHYGMNRVCYVGRPNASAQYLLANGRSPRGPISGEDCIAFNPNALRIEQTRATWTMWNGTGAMLSFPNAAEAYRTLDLIRQYGFTQQCFHRRPNPNFQYFRS
jgi:hypothetical protein